MKRNVFLTAALIALMAAATYAQQVENGFEFTKSGNAVTITGYVSSTVGRTINIPAQIQNTPVTTIGNMAFLNKSISGVTIPAGVTTIGQMAFRNNNITSVTIPASVTNIGSHAFQDCVRLISVTFEGTIPSSGLNSAAFQSNGDLRDKYLAGGAGTYTTATPINRNSVWTKQGTAAIQPNSQSDFTFTKTATGVTITGYQGTATTVVIPDRIDNLPVVKIGDEAFSAVKAVRTAGGRNFDRYYNITSVVIPNTVTEIGYGAFNGLDNLTTFNIPNSVTTIGDNAFGDCSGLTTVTSPSATRRITFVGGADNHAFSGCPLDATSRRNLQSWGYTGVFGR